MKKTTTKEITLYGLLIALTTVATMLIQVPIPATKGYVNFGDGILIMAGLLLGKRAGFLAGGVGSALADLLLGYTWFAPITLVVKGFEGFLAGWLFHEKKIPAVVSAAIGGLFMVGGYFAAEVFMYGAPAAAVSLIPNGMQAFAGVVISNVLFFALKKIQKPLHVL